MDHTKKEWRSEYGKINYLIFLLGVIMLGIGFFLLSQGAQDGFQSRTLGPMVLLVAFVVIFPLAVWARFPVNHKGD